MAYYQGNSKEALRAMQLTKKRQQQQEDIEIKKKKIEEENKMKSIDNKFQQHYDAVEQLLKTDTIGLVTLEDMKKKQEKMVEQRQQQLALERKAKLDEENEKKQKKEHQKNQIQKLSFAEEWNDEEEEDDEDSDNSGNDNKFKDQSQNEKDEDSKITNKDSNSSDENRHDEEMTKNKGVFAKKRFGKNPNVDTSFLPDKDRQAEEDELREKLRREWVERQEKLKNEEIEIVFSYWDGSGHRRSTILKKGHTIQQFLYKCLDQLRKENQFNELKVTTVDQLMYIKEDIILPQHYTFYDLIVTKARGKSGPLFIFDCHDDVRITNDASIEKEESHAGKVVLRSWYERHKHIFPASRWEPYDPEKKWDKPYTIKDKK